MRKSLLLVPFLAASLWAQGFNYFDPADSTKVPKTLSATGLYTDIAAKKMIAAAVRFDVNSALWSDAAVKLRWILLKPGTQVAFRDKEDYYDYPDGAIFVKQFALDTVPGDSLSRVIWETRFLVNKKSHMYDDTSAPIVDKWYGFSYRWRKNQLDADLVSIGYGHDDSLHIKGTAAMKKWHFPSQDDCWRCHVQGNSSGEPSGQARSVLGFFTAQLNRKYWHGPGNQLDSLFARNVLKGTKADWNLSPKWFALTDSAVPGATLDARARSYIGANCSGCHSARGNANHAAGFTNFNYDYFTGAPAEELRYRPVRRGDMISDVAPTTVDPALIVPHYPQKSLLLYRQTVRNTVPGDFTPTDREMPPLASYEVNQTAVALLTRWIQEMDTSMAGVRPGAARATQRAALLLGRTLVLPSEWVKGISGVTMAGVDGRPVALRAAGPGRYEIPSGMPRGVYVFRAGAWTFLRQVLE